MPTTRRPRLVKPVKVCFFIPALSDGGAQKQCIYLLNELQLRDDIELVLIRNGEGVHDHLLNTDRLEVCHIRVGSNYDPRVLLNLVRVIRRTKPDILISWLHASDVYSYFARRAFPRLKWLMTERDSNYPDELRYKVRERLGRHADGIVSNSRAGDEYWAARRARGARYVVNNIVTRAPSESVSSIRAQNVLFVGRLEEQKNPIVVARAFCELAARRSDLRFQMVGEGSTREALESIIRDAGLAHRVELPGFRDDVRSLIATARLVVSLSEHEGSPNVLLESVSAGTPIVASSIAPHHELLGPDYPFLVEQWRDPHHAANMIERAVDDPAAADALAFAQSRVAAMTPQAVADHYMAIFTKTLASR